MFYQRELCKHNFMILKIIYENFSTLLLKYLCNYKLTENEKANLRWTRHQLHTQAHPTRVLQWNFAAQHRSHLSMNSSAPSKLFCKGPLSLPSNWLACYLPAKGWSSLHCCYTSGSQLKFTQNTLGRATLPNNPRVSHRNRNSNCCPFSIFKGYLCLR